MCEFLIENLLPALRCPQVCQGQQPASPSQPMQRTEEESGSLFCHRDILKKQPRKDHSSAGGTRPREVYLPSLSLPSQIKRSDWQRFHFYHKPILYDWALMGFLWITCLCFHCIFFVLIKIHYDTESSLSGSAPLQKTPKTNWNWAFSSNRRVTIKDGFRFLLMCQSQRHNVLLVPLCCSEAIKIPDFPIKVISEKLNTYELTNNYGWKCW